MKHHRIAAALLGSASVLASALPAPAAGSGYFFRSRPMVIEAAVAELRANAPGTVEASVGEAVPALVATGGTAPYRWAGKGLPAGVSVSPDGAVSADRQGSWSGLSATVTDSAGKTADVAFSLTARATGPLFGFGANGRGQLLANATPAVVDTPVALGDGRDWEKVAGVMESTCGIRGGDLWCWGQGTSGELGTGSKDNVSTGPKLVSQSGWSDVQGGYGNFACGIRNDQVHCWGTNPFGQLGVGDENERTVPTSVEGMTGVSAMSKNQWNACAIKAGELWCWGHGGFGQLGIGTNVASNRPKRVGASNAWTAVAVGQGHACGVDGGTLKCWGANQNGQLGRGTKDAYAVTAYWSPNAVPNAGSGWTALSAGTNHTCGIRNGSLLCWGSNGHGRIGNNSTDPALSPVAVGGNGWTALASGDAHTCGIRNGDLLCWGYNAQGGLGIGGTSAAYAPRLVSGNVTGWKTVAAGSYHTLATR